jgi:hypothetical protein
MIGFIYYNSIMVVSEQKIPCKLETFEYPVDWSGNKLSRKEINNLEVGTIIRVIVLYNDNCYQKYYIKISNIDLDKNQYIGNVKYIYKLQTFIDSRTGKPIKYFEILQNKQEITFRSENIFEIGEDFLYDDVDNPPQHLKN